MDRMSIQSLVSDKETTLQLDKKSMPGENGPSFMITADGCFKGYITRKKDGSYQPLGSPYYSEGDLIHIAEQIKKMSLNKVDDVTEGL